MNGGQKGANLGALWTIQQSLVEKDGFRRNAFLSVGYAVMVEGVPKAPMIRCIRKPKARKIRGNDAIIARQLRDQVAKHMA